MNHFEYLKEIKGIGLFVGEPGSVKTYTARYFINNLNLDVGACYNCDIYNNIKNEIKRYNLPIIDSSIIMNAKGEIDLS